MADVKISQLPASTTPLDGTEVLPIVQSATTKQVSVANLTAGRAVSALSLSLTNALPVSSGGTGLQTTGAGTFLVSATANNVSATATPSLGVASTTSGTLSLYNSSSANAVTIASGNNSGAWTFTLPTSGGTNNYILTTNGSGTTQWTNPTALGVDLDVGTTAITGGTSGRILYDNAGFLGELTTGTGVATAIGNNTNSASGLAVLNSSGYLNVAQGGTGLGSLTAGYIPYGNGTGAFSNSANLYFSGSELGVNTSGSASGTVDAKANAYSTFVARASTSGSGQNVNVLKVTDSDVAYFANANYYASSHIWNIGGSPAMTLDTSGNLGVGVTGSFARKLTVVGAADTQATFGNTSPSISLTNAVTSPNTATQTYIWCMATSAGSFTLPNSGDSMIGGIGNSRGDLYLNPNYSGTGTKNVILCPNSGNAGIGTSSPSNKLHVIQSTASTTCSVIRGVSGAQLIVDFSGNGATYYDASSHNFRTIAGSPTVTIDASGNLLVGTTSVVAAERLRVAGTAESYATFTASTNSVNALIGVDGTNSRGFTGTLSNHNFQIRTNNSERVLVDTAGNVIVNTAAIATNATDGFLYVPTCAGTPTGTPTTYTGRAPIVVNTTNNKLYFYSGGAWRDAGP